MTIKAAYKDPTVFFGVWLKHLKDRRVRYMSWDFRNNWYTISVRY